MPTDYEIARAQRLGRATAAAGRPLNRETNPFNANGDGKQRVLAMRFTRAYLNAKPAAAGTIDYTGDDDGE